MTSPVPPHQVTANPWHHRRVGRACREAGRGTTVGPVIVRLSSPLNTDTPVVVVGRAVAVSHGIKGPLFLPSVRPFLRLDNNLRTTSSTTNTTTKPNQSPNPNQSDNVSLHLRLLPGFLHRRLLCLHQLLRKFLPLSSLPLSALTFKPALNLLRPDSARLRWTDEWTVGRVGWRSNFFLLRGCGRSLNPFLLLVTCGNQGTFPTNL